MSRRLTKWTDAARRSPHGERGLKSHLFARQLDAVACRSPHGERGLKYDPFRHHGGDVESLSSRRAWIEILARARWPTWCGVALLTESVD